jgi:acyl-CoA hydrolase
MNDQVTSMHRLVLPCDANHYGTLYAGSLLRIALEAAYVAACRTVGEGANLVLRRVLSLECYRPVPVGSLIEVRGVTLHLTRVYQVVGLIGTRQGELHSPWMDGLMGFVQVGADGQVAEFPEELAVQHAPDEWNALRRRMEKLLRLRVKLTDD